MTMDRNNAADISADLNDRPAYQAPQLVNLSADETATGPYTFFFETTTPDGAGS